MVAIVKTNEKVVGNYAANNAYVLITRLNNPKTDVIVNWKNYNNVVWKKYQIKESDLRTKTSTFTSPQYLDLTTGTYAILITTPLHEDFGGVIIGIDYDPSEGLYEYQCQDWSRFYQSKFELISKNKSVHRILKHLITRGGIPLVGAISKTKAKKYAKALSGLRPAYQYDEKAFGGVLKNFNPMTNKNPVIFRGKSYIEAIRALVYNGAYIDVFFDKFGVLHVEPFHKDDFFNTGLLLTNAEITEMSQSFDTTNVITGVRIHNSNKAKSGAYVSSRELIGIDLAAIFGRLETSMDTTVEQKTTAKSSAAKKKSSKKTKTGNPYKTKKKEVWINSDNVHGYSTDKKFINDVANILRKNGWKVKVTGVGSHAHEEGNANVKNGVWFTVYGGADQACFYEAGLSTSFSNKLKRNKSRNVIGMTNISRGGRGDIRKGGKHYKWLERSHDDDYSHWYGMKYPLDWLTKHKIPICYGNSAKEMAAKFLAGGEDPKAC